MTVALPDDAPPAATPLFANIKGDLERSAPKPKPPEAVAQPNPPKETPKPPEVKPEPPKVTDVPKAEEHPLLQVTLRNDWGQLDTNFTNLHELTK